MDDSPIVEPLLNHDQGNDASPSGECYLLSASWVDRGGKVGGGSLVGVFATPDDATNAILGYAAQVLGRARALVLMKAKRLGASYRVLEPDDLEEMAALVRQHRASQAAGAEG